MAAVVLGVTTPSTSNVEAYASGAFTPALDDLLVLFIAVTGTGVQGTVSDSQGGTWNIRTWQDEIRYWIRNEPAPNTSMTVTATFTGDAGTGCDLTVLRVPGMSLFGSAAGRQLKSAINQAAATPALTFDAAVLTDNPTIGVVKNATNPAGLTPPTNWTERSDNGYNTPTTGMETISRDSGFTGTTITWGSASASTFDVVIVELDASLVTVDGVALSVTPSLPAGRVDHSLTGIVLATTPTLPAGEVSSAGGETVTGIALSVSPTLPAGQVDLSITAVALVVTPSLPAGSLDLSVAAVVLTVTPSLPAAQVQQSVIGTALVVVPSLPAGTVGVELGGVVLAVVPSLPAGHFAVELAGAALVVVPSLPIGTVSTGVIGVAVPGPTDVLITAGNRGALVGASANRAVTDARGNDADVTT